MYIYIYSKTDYTYFVLNFALNIRCLVHIPMNYVLSKNKENNHTVFLFKNVIFTVIKNRSSLHRHVNVMERAACLSSLGHCHFK